MNDSEAAPERKQKDRRALAWVVGPIAAFLVFVVLILATGTPSSADLMKQATASFGEVHRGVFTFQITITPKGAATAQPSTIKLSGPFELVPGKPLPKAKITYTVSSGGRSQVTTLLTTGDKAYTVIKGQAYELPSTATKELKAATKDLSKGGKGKDSGLTGIRLNFGKWLVSPEVASGRQIDGTATWQTSAGVNVIAALQDLTSSANALGGITGQQVPQLKKSDIAEVKKGIKNAHVVVYVGRYDHIVRLMDLTMDFATPTNLTAAAGGVSGGRMNLLVGIAKPNQAVDVEAPANPLPFKALQSLAASQSAQTGTALDDGLGQ
ncbi:MAG: hypothetical protein ACRDKI_05460 [Solirubrobacterales bacterium]